MENLFSRTSFMDGVSMLQHHMYRFNSYGFIVTYFKDMQFTDSELGD